MKLETKQNFYWVFYPIIVLKALYAIVLRKCGSGLKRQMPEDEWEAIENSGIRFMLFYMEWRIRVLQHLLYSPRYGICAMLRELIDNPDLEDPLFPSQKEIMELYCLATDRFLKSLVEKYEILKKDALAAEHLNLWVVNMEVIILLDDIAAAVDDGHDRARKHYKRSFKKRWKVWMERL